MCWHLFLELSSNLVVELREEQSLLDKALRQGYPLLAPGLLTTRLEVARHKAGPLPCRSVCRSKTDVTAVVCTSMGTCS